MLDDDNFICIYLHGTIQVKDIKTLPIKLLTELHKCLLTILKEIRKQISTMDVSGENFNRTLDRSIITSKNKSRTAAKVIPKNI